MLVRVSVWTSRYRTGMERCLDGPTGIEIPMSNEDIAIRV
ncbi:hypothetical protein BJ970_006823 [Saccharopolyspora phatthalungensis]|uniref:Uncharacterized protein n=1 Tax=Saccharopolyspora phatthalungensis TaxID=664693 RepID=A0A840QEJ0_9PSEU|nr:hypothetical protein [Saccharopolyspora phatthalungensis]